MRKFLGLAVAGLTAFSASALAQHAQPNLERVRGTIASVSGNTLTVTSRDGKAVQVMLGAGTKYAWVVPSSLSDIKSGDFIGTATKGPSSHMVALEVVVFPNSMRGTGEGHYPWDMLPNTAASGGGAPAVQSSMTNGTVAGGGGSSNAPMVSSTMTNGTVGSAAAPGNAPMVSSSMTNGTVAANTGSGGGKELTVGYGGGKKLRVLVPANVPVVGLDPTQRSALASGAKVFVIAAKPSSGGGGLDAKFVAVGKDGLTPPM